MKKKSKKFWKFNIKKKNLDKPLTFLGRDSFFDWWLLWDFFWSLLLDFLDDVPKGLESSEEIPFVSSGEERGKNSI